MDITEFKRQATKLTELKLTALLKSELKITKPLVCRQFFQAYAEALIKGYELATGTELDKDLRTYLIIDILVDSGVLATVLV